ncbi:predicted protein [Naegleria gruberi]|uniref:Predicted protein n=1 Tax=Naegleria gruberi TaxID=5762 RepID=D2VBY9_NAEGR|nr:uncharacterized protein NAEGRDRAFT_66385 [Naegleria gruberi]EFC45562.1 predicted protein [Naegleria gruberi]|eukprot:XP_002678306.1 predicted protein [Naegleria gruberi strain NEG-M]
MGKLRLSTRLFQSSLFLLLVLCVLSNQQQLQQENWYDSLSDSWVDAYVSSYLNAYMWKTSSLASTTIQSRDGLIQYLRGTNHTAGQSQQSVKIGVLYHKVDLEHVKNMWQQVKEFYGWTSDMDTFKYSFLTVDDMDFTCRQFHAFDDFDIVVTSEEYFYKIVRVFRTGNRKDNGIWYTYEDFQSYSIVPIKILQIAKEPNIYSIVNYLESRIDSNCTNSSVIYQHDSTEEIIYKIISNSLNGTIYENSDFQRFVKKFSPNSLILSSNSVEDLKSLLISRLNYGSSSSNYYQNFKTFLRPNCTQCLNDFCASVSFIQTDYWIVPSTVMVILYFAALFLSKAFLTPSIKRRLLIPYLPFIIVYIESQYLSPILNYCSRGRLLILGFVINWYLITYGLTIIRLYLLRNMYTLISKSKFSNIRIQKILSGDLIGIVLTGGLSFLITCFISLPFYFVFLPQDQYLFSSIFIGISVVLGSLLSLLGVVIDIITNRKKFSKKGISYYIFFDDPFMIRIELLSLAMITILVVILGTLNLYGIPVSLYSCE